MALSAGLFPQPNFLPFCSASLSGSKKDLAPWEDGVEALGRTAEPGWGTAWQLFWEHTPTPPLPPPPSTLTFALQKTSSRQGWLRPQWGGAGSSAWGWILTDSQSWEALGGCALWCFLLVVGACLLQNLWWLCRL